MKKPLQTTIAGSLPKPNWLAKPGELWAPWRLEGEALAEGKRDAVRLAVRDQEEAAVHPLAFLILAHLAAWSHGIRLDLSLQRPRTRQYVEFLVLRTRLGRFRLRKCRQAQQQPHRRGHGCSLHGCSLHARVSLNVTCTASSCPSTTRRGRNDLPFGTDIRRAPILSQRPLWIRRVAGAGVYSRNIQQLTVDRKSLHLPVSPVRRRGLLEFDLPLIALFDPSRTPMLIPWRRALIF